MSLNQWLPLQSQAPFKGRAPMTTRVTVWNEFRHEKDDLQVQSLYPDGIHSTIAKALGGNTDFTVRTATLDEPEHGLTQDVLDATDVLIWWGHRAHDAVEDA